MTLRFIITLWLTYGALPAVYYYYYYYEVQFYFKFDGTEKNDCTEKIKFAQSPSTQKAIKLMAAREGTWLRWLKILNGCPRRILAKVVEDTQWLPKKDKGSGGWGYSMAAREGDWLGWLRLLNGCPRRILAQAVEDTQWLPAKDTGSGGWGYSMKNSAQRSSYT